MTVSMSLLINMWLSSRWCMTVSMSLLINMWLSRRWCKRHSCGREFPSFNLNQLVSVPDFVLNVKFPGLGGKSCFVFCFSRGGVSKKKREIREKLLRWWRSSSQVYFCFWGACRHITFGASTFLKNGFPLVICMGVVRFALSTQNPCLAVVAVVR